MPASVASSIQSPLVLSASEVEEAFLAACNGNAIRDVEVRATMSLSISHWHRLKPETQGEIIHAVRNFFPIH